MSHARSSLRITTGGTERSGQRTAQAGREDKGGAVWDAGAKPGGLLQGHRREQLEGPGRGSGSSSKAGQKNVPPELQTAMR